jgi:hypothetical protein
VAEGRNWSDGLTAQRTYDYWVEPQDLQQLPVYTLLLTRHARTRTRAPDLSLVEFNPEIPALAAAEIARRRRLPG